MKQLSALLLVFAILFIASFSFSSCVPMEKISCPPETDEKIESAAVEKFEPVKFAAQYIRTGWTPEDQTDPDSAVIRSKKELDYYYESNREKYNLERREDPASDSTIGFLDACDRYNENYFEDHILLMVTTEEGSGSIRHKVEKVLSSKEKLEVYIKRIVPEVGTDDMAGWHILVELPKDIEIAEEDITVFLDGVDPLKNDIIARHGKNHANISVKLPYDWKYEVIHGENENDNSFCIAISPEKETQGTLKIWYYPSLGFCGTGLTIEEITLGKYEAYRGSYAGDKLWYYISFPGLAGDYYVINDGAEAWWDEYGEKAMEILQTLTLAEGIITEAEAIKIAKKNCDLSFDTVQAEFQVEKGYWNVSMSNGNLQGSVYVCTITSEGKFLDLAIGDRKG